MIRIEIVGNLGRNAERKEINGRDYLSFPVAPTGGGKREGDTMWVSCLYRNTNVGEWLTKGRAVFVRGEYSDKVFTRRDGAASIDRSVMVSELELLGRRDGDDSAPQRTEGRPAARGAAAPQGGGDDDDDDDLPF